MSAKIILLGFFIQLSALSAQVKSPEEFLGAKIGSDRTLVDWDQIVDYFRMLNGNSDRVSVRELGKTTLSQPFIMATISSPMNLKNLAKFKNLQKQAANPRHLSDEDARTLARQNKVVVLVTLNIHAREIASSQAAIEIAHLLATAQDDRVLNIMQNVIILLVPSLNPDGVDLLVEWYNQHLGTPFEGSPAPVLEHHYAGEENDNDWFMLNLVETRLVVEQAFQQWFPQVFYAQHPLNSDDNLRFVLTGQMVSKRTLHPHLVDKTNQFVASLQGDLREQGLATHNTGTMRQHVLSRQIFAWHNVVGIIPEVATAQMASPIYFPIGNEPRDRTTDQYKAGTNAIGSWPGGWWRLRDMIDYEIASLLAVLERAADEKESLVYDFCKMNLEAIETGHRERPYAFVVTKSQRAPAAATELIGKLMSSGVEIHGADKDFVAAGKGFDQGDYVILLTQPRRNYIKALLELHVDSGRNSFGSKESASWNLPLMMGVKVERVNQPFEADLTRLETIRYPSGSVDRKGKGGFLISHKTNRSFSAVNRLLRRRKKVHWLVRETKIDGRRYQPGAIYIPPKELTEREMRFLSEDLSLDVLQTSHSLLGSEAFRLHPFRLGLYQPWTGNADEGWTRFILEQFDFPYRSIYSAKIASDNLRGDFDVIIIPDMTASEIITGRGNDTPNTHTPRLPEPYGDGIGAQGVKNLLAFVEKGGVLIALNRASDFAIQEFGLPAENTLSGVSEEEFFCRGALLEIVVDNTEPLAYGMPNTASALFFDSPAFRPIPWMRRTAVPAYYPDKNLLLSGRMLGSENLYGRAAVLDIPVGGGRVVLVGFKSQHRAQTPGTYKFLFNTIHLSKAERVILKK